MAEKKEKMSPKIRASLIRWLALFFIIVFLIFAIFFTTIFVDEMKGVKLIEMDRRVMATYTQVSQKGSQLPFCRVYTYRDENNKFYSGYDASNFSTYSEAEAHLGEQVEIWIDGKGNSRPTFATHVNPTKWGVLMGAFYLLAIAAFVVLIFPFAKLSKNKQVWRSKDEVEP